jgi:peptide/nickel transport system substrate-binding protein
MGNVSWDRVGTGEEVRTMKGLPKFTFWRIAALAAAAALVATAIGFVPTEAKSAGRGVVTFAETPGATPSYIFPLVPGQYLNNATVYQFDNEMYLPLYWFGDHGKPVLNKALSVANPPVFSHKNTMVSITLKHWKWSNGDPVTARDVIFWMNLLSAVTDPNAPVVTGSNGAAGPGWGGSVAGYFPENVVSYAQTGTYSLTLKLSASDNPTWFLYNELCQIYPMPQKAWDKTSAAAPIGNEDATAEARSALPNTSPTQYVPTNPGTATTGALGVAQFLNSQSQDLVTYTTNPLWKIVDGPFRLTRFTTSGFAKMVPNLSYSGSPKPKIAAFEEVPFTSTLAEFNALRSGSLTIGYLPPEDLGQRASLEKEEGYDFSEWHDFGFAYLPINFTNPTAGPILKQLYFRQAFQSLINQPQYIKQFLGGFGSIENGPVPTYPPGYLYASRLETHGQVYPFDPAKAVKLLKDNGWTVVPGGTSYCIKPGTVAGDCGLGIKAHQPASLNLLYGSGTVEETSEMEALQSTMKSKAGIAVDLSSEPTSEVGAGVFGCTFAKPCSNWELVDLNFARTWTFGPGFFPSGEQLFATGAAFNVGDYSIATNDANVKATTSAPTKAAEIAAMVKYEDYVAKDLPVFWLPSGYIQLTMYKRNLKGLVPQDVLDIVYPQEYSFSKN